MTTEIIPGVKKIGILRANALGDFIVILPALAAIHHSYPLAEIILFGQPWHKEFLQHCRTEIDRVVIVPFIKGIRSGNLQEENKEEIEVFFQQMQEEKFDIILNFQGQGIAANPFVKRMKPGLTVGLTSPGAEPIDRSLPFYYYQSEVVRYLEVASLIGAKVVTNDPFLKVLDHDRQEVVLFLNALQLTSKKFIVFHPCAVDIRRMWVEERWALLADLIIERGFDIIFSGSKNDTETIERIFHKMKHKAYSTIDKLSLGGLAALFLKSKLVISVDTGPLHLAGAVGAGTIGLYWAPNLINWAPLSRKNQMPLVDWEMKCPICGIVPNDPYPFEPHTEACSHAVSFTSHIIVEAVMRAVENFL